MHCLILKHKFEIIVCPDNQTCVVFFCCIAVESTQIKAQHVNNKQKLHCSCDLHLKS